MGMNAIHLEQFNTLEIGTIFLPSRIVSGDHLELITISETQTGVLLFDVAGKGIDAGISRNAILKLFHAIFESTYSPTEVINQVHQHLCLDDALATFATVFYGIIDTNRHTLTYVNAGHDPIIHLHNGCIHTLDAKVMQMGADITDVYTETRVAFIPSDKLIIYSDGIPDARNIDEESFGFERIKKLVMQNDKTAPTELARTLHESVMDFSFGREQKDDLSLMVIGYKNSIHSSFSLEKTASVATLSLDADNSQSIRNLLEPALLVKSFDSTTQLLDHFKHNPDDIIVVFSGSTISVEDITQICTHSKLLELIVISDNSDSDWCKSIMKAGARHIAKPSNGITYLKTLVKDSIKRVDALRRSFLSTYQTVSDWISFTTDVLQCCQRSNIPISRYELASVCKLAILGGAVRSDEELISSQLNTTSPIILMVEDDAEVRQRIGRNLSFAGYTFFVAENKSEAMDVIKSQEINCCLLDIGLPDGSGIDLITELKRVNPDIEIIMVTAFNNADNIIPAFQHGVLDYIVKPIDKKELFEKIEEASRRNFMNYLAKQDPAQQSVAYADIRLRLRIAEQFVIHAILNHRPIRYQDIYVFFPEMKQTHPKEAIIPTLILKKDPQAFITNLLKE